MRDITRTRWRCESGFSLVEVLVAAVVFAGVFLMLFTLLAALLTRSNGSDLIRAANIADLRLAQFREGVEVLAEELVVLDSVSYRVLSSLKLEPSKRTLRLTVLRTGTGDTLGRFYAIQYANKTRDDIGHIAR